MFFNKVIYPKSVYSIMLLLQPLNIFEIPKFLFFVLVFAINKPKAIKTCAHIYAFYTKSVCLKPVFFTKNKFCCIVEVKICKVPNNRAK